jgi:hypothetical protein
MATEQGTRRSTIAVDRHPLDDAALRRLARGDALLAYRTRADRLALVAWLALLALVVGFLAAVGVSVVLDATGVAF